MECAQVCYDSKHNICTFGIGEAIMGVIESTFGQALFANSEGRKSEKIDLETATQLSCDRTEVTALRWG